MNLCAIINNNSKELNREFKSMKRNQVRNGQLHSKLIKRMKAKETMLKSIAFEVFGERKKPFIFDRYDLDSSQRDELSKVYYSLGGRLTDVPLRFGAWDILTPDFIIELDEEQHFNRYRLQTLSNHLYQSEVGFNIDLYRQYCVSFEQECLKKASYGKYWINDSTRKQFGEGDSKGILGSLGSPRWKQRAFYDFCRDFFSVILDFPLYRFSIYDELNSGSINLGKALDKGLRSEIESFILKRIQGE